MSSDPTWGIDVSGSPWLCVRVGLGREAAGDVEDSRRIAGPDLLREAEPLLLPTVEGDLTEPTRDDWFALRDWLHRAREPILAQLPDLKLVGVAYPRSMPPILRQYLPIALGCEAATSQGGLPYDSPLVGLDAPVALMLEAVARNAAPARGRFAVASGFGASREWTAVAVETAPSASPTTRGPILRLRVGATADTPDAIGVDASTPRLIAGSDTIELSPPGTTVVRLHPAAIAAGAARFARWHSLELSPRPSTSDWRLQAALLPGKPVIEGETTHSLGLIGDNGRGNRFWRRLFEPGTAIPTNRAILRSMTRPPCSLHFAECLSPSHQRSRWLSQEEWSGARLRWHSTTSLYATTVSTAANGRPTPIRWIIELRDFNDTRRDTSIPREEAPARWGLPTWRARPAGDSDAPPTGV